LKRLALFNDLENMTLTFKIQIWP